MFVALFAYVALTFLAASPAHADGFFDNLGKAAGLVAPPADPPDFVKDSRSKEETKPIAVFAPPDEPSSKVKTPAEIKAMDADLEGAAHNQNAPRTPRAAKARLRSSKYKVKSN
jgi:hypothetical protein